jgi:23S rRNA (cytidine2498-2'-O)-methyltransferase
MVCDVACYPDRLYNLVTRWLAAGKVRRMICTIKLQGKTDFVAIERFKQIPDSQTLHLSQNKHELTWIWPAPKTLSIFNKS